MHLIKQEQNLAEQGSVSRMFQRKGQIFVDKSIIGEEALMGYTGGGCRGSQAP